MKILHIRWKVVVQEEEHRVKKIHQVHLGNWVAGHKGHFEEDLGEGDILPQMEMESLRTAFGGREMGNHSLEKLGDSWAEDIGFEKVDYSTFSGR